MTHLDLTSLDKQQLIALLWELQGVPTYQELRARSPETTIKILDLDCENKADETLRQSLDITNAQDGKRSIVNQAL